jgi:hypothetical protein
MKSIVKVICSLTLAGAAAAPSFAQAKLEPAPEVKRAIDGVLDLFKQNDVVVLCETYHGLAQEADFYSALVRDRRFAENIGNVVVEFGGEGSQAIIDRYVSGAEVPFVELRRVWTETYGWIPGPTRLGYINFYANVRAANLNLPPEHRIKVWLGDPKIDWSKINSYTDLLPYVGHRDDNYFRIISTEILQKHKKTLLIIGSGHIFGAGMLSAKFNLAYPKTLATIMPFTGYIEPECNARIVAQGKDWPIPAVVGPIAGTLLKSQLQLPGCNFIPAEQVERLKATPAAALAPFSSVADMIHGLISEVSGQDADAILYLGPPDTLTLSPVDPAIYLDPDYFREEDRRSRCCTSPPGRGPLDWDGILQQNSVSPRRLFPSRD